MLAFLFIQTEQDNTGTLSLFWPATSRINSAQTQPRSESNGETEETGRPRQRLMYIEIATAELF